jgi:hypothetical protein
MALSISASIAVALLVLAAWRRFGPRLVLLSVSALVLYFTAKEAFNVRGLLLGHYYTIDEAFFQIGGVSPTIIVGHCFTFLTGMLAADRILAVWPRLGRSFATYLIVVGWAAGAISYAMEAVGMMNGWWHWQETVGPFELSYSQISHIFILVPPTAVGGWTTYMVIFYCGFFLGLRILIRVFSTPWIWLSLVAPLVMLAPLYRDLPASMIHYVFAVATCLGLAVWGVVVRLGWSRAWLALVPTLVYLWMIVGEGGAMISFVGCLALYFISVALDGLNWTPLIEASQLDPPVLDRTASFGFSAAMVLFFAVLIAAHLQHAGSTDPRAWVTLLPVVGLVLVTVGRVPIWAHATAWFLVAAAAAVLKKPHLIAAALFTAGWLGILAASGGVWTAARRLLGRFPCRALS